VTTPQIVPADLWGPPRPPRAYGALDLGFAALVLLAVQTVAGLASLAYELGAAGTDASQVMDSSLVLLTGMVSMWAVFCGWPWVVARRLGAGLTAVVGPWVTGHSGALRTVAVSVGLGLALRAVSLLVDQAAAAAGWTVEGNSDWLTTDRPWLVGAVLLLGAAVIGPVAEEVFFRGLAMRSIRQTLQRRWAGGSPRSLTAASVLVSSVLFGLAHASTLDADGAVTNPLTASGVYVVAQTATIGAVLAVLALRRGLVASCAAHVAFNTTGVLLLLATAGAA